MSTATIYQIQPADRSTLLNVTELGQATGDWEQYVSLSRVSAGGKVYLLGFNAAADELDVYEVLTATPWVKAVNNKLNLKTKAAGKRNIVNSFTLGNRSYLSAYTAKNGIFEIYEFADDFSLSAPLEYYRNHEPAITKNFTTVKFFTNFGQVTMLGYDTASGYVAAYTIGMIATSPAGVPPVALTPVWSHMWAPGWTRFAFFQFGGANFFLKTNTAKPNVNIDHINDVLSMGTVEIGSKLDLDDAQALNNVEPFVLREGDPYFVTYLKASGKITVYRFRSDCRGWNVTATLASKTNATLITPISTTDGKVLLLVG